MTGKFYVHISVIPELLFFENIFNNYLNPISVICYNLKIKKFPAFKYYQRGQFITDFGGATADDFVIYLEENARRSERDEL